MKKCLPMIGLALVLFLLPARSGSSQEKPGKERSPELKVLDHFLGSWDIQFTGPREATDGPVEKVGSRRRWSQGGKVLIFEDDGEEELVMTLTYDAVERQYVGTFLLGGMSGHVEGKWESRSKTMNLVIAMKNGNVYRGDHRFIQREVAEVRGKVFDSFGNLLTELSWKQTLRKSPNKKR